MISANSPFGLAVLLLLAVVAFLLPGWMISRRLGSPAPAITAFLLSATLWFQLILVCDFAGLRLSRSLVVGGWSVLCLIAAVLARRTRAPREPGFWQRIKPTGGEWIWFAAAAAGFASILARAVIDPLSGWDNRFRWDYLARAMLVHGRLGFYPPVHPADFEVYGWCDGIPPLVPLLNLWVYLVTGAADASLTAVRVAGEAVLLGVATFGFGRQLWGARGGWPAVGLLATSALLLWGVAMGQETGLLALTLLALMWLLEEHRREPRTVTVFWAGLAAGVGAISRDYGLAYPLLGLAILALHRGRPRAMLQFAVTATAIAGPWYLRNWLRTGNPVFPITLGGLFPSNPAYLDLMQRIRDAHSLAPSQVNYGLLGATLAVLAGGVTAAALPGLRRARRLAVAPLAALALTGALWIWSVPWTAGGLNYSLRVLVPAVALGAVLGGWLGTLGPGAGRTLVSAAALVLAVDAARRSWLLPMFPRASALSWSFADWRAVWLDLRRIENDPLWDYLVRAAGDGLIAVDNPDAHVALVARGGRCAMVFSPALAACFDTTRPFADTVRRLRAEHVKLFVLSVGDPVARSFIAANPFFETLRSRFRPMAEVQSLAIYDLDQLSPLGS